MLEALFGNSTAVLVLLYLERKGGLLYATEVATGMGIPLNMVQKQLERLERGGILISKREGKRKNYRWDTRFGLLTPMRQLLARANSLGNGDPANGLHLTLAERLTETERLWRELDQLRKPRRTAPFVISFETWRDYARWKETPSSKRSC